MRADEIMSEDPVWVDVLATTGEAMRKLVESRVHHLPVLRNGVLVGMLSDRDLRSAGPMLLALLEDPRAAAARLDEPVSSVMTSDLVTAFPDTDLKDVASAMIERHIGAVPVVDPESGKLVGIVSYVDVLRAVRDLLWG